MKILVIGQCSLHWGRMEFGNIGNYYIVEPFFRELHRNFPGASIRTTMQMSERFCQQENITTLPLEIYYGWRDNELRLAKKELELSERIKNFEGSNETTPYIEAVRWADLVIDFSGDIWGDNANFLGDDRFEVGLMKDLVAQNLGKPVAMLAGSPGPFSRPDTRERAKRVYAQFDLVTNRESISTELLRSLEFDTSNTMDLACPAFLFEPELPDKMIDVLCREGLLPYQRRKPIVGYVLCGWNFRRGPFDMWPRDDEDYLQFAESVEFLSIELGVQVCLMSHANGFDVPPADFRLKHGRDYPIIKQLEAVIQERGFAKDVISLDGVYDAKQTKAIIGGFDMLVSGRVHAAVAALSQSVPTVIIDYGHEPKAHKLTGFANISGISEYVANPHVENELTNKIEDCWRNRKKIRRFLDLRIPEIQNLSRQNFTQLTSILL